MWAAPLSEYGRIRRVALRRPAESFVDQKRLDGEWQRLNYTGRPDYAGAQSQYDRLVSILKDQGSEIDFLPADPALTIDSIYVRDATIVGPLGLILCNMGKAERRGEPAVAETAFRKLGLPVAGRIEGEGMVEGGDMVWFDDRTLAVGHTYRTNDEGIRQLGKLVGPDVEVVVADMPHYRGPGRCVPSDVGALAHRPRSGAGLFAADADPLSRLADRPRHQAGRGAG